MNTDQTMISMWKPQKSNPRKTQNYRFFISLTTQMTSCQLLSNLVIGFIPQVIRYELLCRPYNITNCSSVDPVYTVQYQYDNNYQECCIRVKIFTKHLIFVQCIPLTAEKTKAPAISRRIFFNMASDSCSVMPNYIWQRNRRKHSNLFHI